MSGGRVAVVVPVHDGAAFVAEALASAVGQSRPPEEIVAVDDGSTDDGAAVLASFPGVRYLPRPHRGVAAARNAGVAATGAELIAFLDQDDRWTPDKLAVQVAHLESRPDLGFCLARQRLFLEPGAERPPWLRPELLAEDQPGYVPGTLVVRREIFEAVGPFDEDRPIASDADWFLRAKDAAVRMEMLPDMLLERRIHRENQSAQTLQGTRELLAAVRASVARQRRAAAEGLPG